MLRKPLNCSQDRGDRIVDELLRFSQSTLGASAVALAWLNQEGEHRLAGKIGLREALLEDYVQDGVHSLDPLFPKVLVSKAERVHSLSALEAVAQGYITFLTRYGYRDEIDLVFFNGKAPVACLSALSDQSFANPLQPLDVLHRFLQHTINDHPHVRYQSRTTLLRDRFRLSSREIQVVELISSAGASNADIARCLNISLATVKTHVIRALDKLGVSSRCALVAFVNQL